MDTAAKRLKAARELRGVNQVQLAAMAGVSPGTVGNIESGKRGVERSALAFAKALRIDAQWLATGEGEMLSPYSCNTPSAIATIPLRKIKLIKLEEVGMYQEILSDVDIPETEPVTTQAGKEAFAVLITNEATEPDLPKGATVVCDPSKKPQAGWWVLALQDDVPVIKRVIADGADLYLDGIKPRHINDVKVIGVLIHLLKTLT